MGGEGNDSSGHVNRTGVGRKVGLAAVFLGQSDRCRAGAEQVQEVGCCVSESGETAEKLQERRRARWSFVIALIPYESGHRFVWSLRRPSSVQTSSRVPSNYEEPSEVLLEVFIERTHGIGKVTGWAPQAAVLGNVVVGGFVSHCVWNSLLESLWYGVPSSAWPMYTEQHLNAFEMVVELGLEVEIKLEYMMDYSNPKAKTVVVTAEEIEIGIRRVMDNNELRTKVKEMSAKSRSTSGIAGSLCNWRIRVPLLVHVNAFEMVVELGFAVEIKLDYRKDIYNPKANTADVTTGEIEIGIRRVMEDN
ncbi:putative anthocyanidin 3-O-glucosyltransferase [Helianthus debilis subsp. tardiflorus]